MAGPGVSGRGWDPQISFLHTAADVETTTRLLSANFEARQGGVSLNFMVAAWDPNSMGFVGGVVGGVVAWFHGSSPENDAPCTGIL